jgi:hypothetical protein
MNISNKGLTGEFYVLAQLNARGFDASLTLGNTKGVDIIVMNNKNNKGYKVEVKTSSSKPTNEKTFKDWHPTPTYSWILSKKNETYIADNLIYCFVHISDLQNLPKFYLVHSKIVSKYVKDSHQFWLDLRGDKVKDSDMRKFRIEINGPNNYENNWGLLEK